MTLISSFIYAEPNIQQSDIFAFDPTRGCDVLAVKLKKMKDQIDQKKITITAFEKSLKSAATSSTQYENTRLDYVRTIEQFHTMKMDYERLVLAQKNHCMSGQDPQSISEL